MAELTTEENEIYLLGQARLRLAKKAQAEGSNVLDERKPEANDAIGFVNKGIAKDFLGVPVDAVKAGINLFESERQRGMNAMRRLLGQPEEEITLDTSEPFGGVSP
jgi:molecular chaperone GrpE (heat shock protein)